MRGWRLLRTSRAAKSPTATAKPSPSDPPRQPSAIMRNPAMPRFKRSGFAAVVALTAVGLAACTPSESATGPAGDPRTGTQLVRVATVQPTKATTRGFTGVVSARIQSNLGFRVSGKVIKRLVDTGQTVKAGQPLMRI